MVVMASSHLAERRDAFYVSFSSFAAEGKWASVFLVVACIIFFNKAFIL